MKRKLIILMIALAATILLLSVLLISLHTNAFRGWVEKRAAGVIIEMTGRPASLRIRIRQRVKGPLFILSGLTQE